MVQFSSVHHLTLHFPSNHAGGDETKIYYIGLKGEFTEGHRCGRRANALSQTFFVFFFCVARTGVVNAVYESRPMMEDHKQDVDALGMKGNNPGF